ncbi:MAG: hypothetical protein V3T86_09260 [Planctomycetota bacterium]
MSPVFAQSPSTSTDDTIWIAVLYRKTPTGERHLEGVTDAVAKHRMGTRIKLRKVPYLNEREGDAMLSALVRGSPAEKKLPVHLVLGPTDSGVFLRGKAVQSELAKFKVPVISSLVTAKEENGREDWFLRTNVDVVRRAEAIFDHLNKRWVTSFTIVYVNSEFGRRAEEAFRENLSGFSASHYEAYPFEPGRLRIQIRNVLRRRPEAVGFFGAREDIVSCYESLLAQNDSIVPYRPILFSVVDLRSLHADIDGFHYVSVIQPQSDSPVDATQQPDNVHGLSYDTTWLVLDVIRTLPPLWDAEAFRTSFRANVLAGRGGARGERTAMRFSGGHNAAEVFVYEMSGGRVTHIPAVEVGIGAKVSHKVALVGRRFGLMPLVSLAVILLIVFVTSLNDFRVWYGGRSRRFLRSRYFYGIVALQGVMAAVLFVVTCELDWTRYDSILAAGGIALSPSPLLRTTILRWGDKGVGFARMYDQLLEHWTRRFITSRYTMTKVNTVFVAYYNSLDGLRRRLDEVLDTLPTTEVTTALRAKIDAEIVAAEGNYEKRELCARQLVHLRSWEELKEMGIVPDKAPVNPNDPRSMITAAVMHCLDDDLEKALDRDIESKLKRYPKSKAHLKRKLADAADAPQDILYAKFQFLALRFNYDVDKLKTLKFLPADYGNDAPKTKRKLGLWRRLMLWVEKKRNTPTRRKKKNKRPHQTPS